MKPPDLLRRGHPASDLLEESFRLLRRAPFSAWLVYFLGTIPALLYSLFFLADLSKSADAHNRLFESALLLSLLWLFMKCTQAIFTATLHSQLLLLDPPIWSLSRLAKLALAQVAIQPSGLILRPLALLITIPYIWTATFYQNITILGDGTSPNLQTLCQQAFTQCKLWPRQAHIAATFLATFGLFVWLNIAVSIFFIPQLLQTLLGITTPVTQHPLGLISPLFFATTFAILYLCLDPLRKAFNLLRCFYGSSLRNAADLDVQLKSLRRSSTSAASIALLFFLTFTTLSTSTPTAQPTPPVEASELHHSIDQVLQRREYAWRGSRESLPKVDDQSWLSKLQKDFSTWLRNIVDRFLRWIFPKIIRNPSSAPSTSWASNARPLLVGFLVLATIALLVSLSRLRLRKKLLLAPLPTTTQAQPDLSQENVTADQSDEAGWLALADQLQATGQLRLALRASYLASLAHLSQRELIRLARFKSNRDYDRELQRRARSLPILLSAFNHILLTFESAWYGDHPVTASTLADFSKSLDQIRSC
jgi:hypothetical protein